MDRCGPPGQAARATPPRPDFPPMSQTAPAEPFLRRAELRRAVYALLAVTSIAHVMGRILTVEGKPNEPTPFLSANDRSRWLTVRALVDQGTYEIDHALEPRHGWYTIDMVQHLGSDGRPHYYSSKPPLMATVVAAEYWLIKKLSSGSFARDPYYYGRLLLIITNGLLLVAFFWLTARMLERYGRTTWGRLLAMTTATWGTFLTTFAITLNNHLVAAACALAALYAALRVWTDGERRWRYFLVAGFFSAMTASHELPALSLFACVGLAMLIQDWRRTLLGFTPAAAVVVAAFFITNKIAHDSWRPPYMHRNLGPVVAAFESSAADELAEIVAWAEKSSDDPLAPSRDLPPAACELARRLQEKLKLVVEPEDIAVAELTAGKRWALFVRSGERRFVLESRDDAIAVRDAADHWYLYPGSYWITSKKTDVDRGEPNRAVYAFHVLVGHHGVFSLTPIWLLSIVGVVLLVRVKQRRLRGPALMIAALTLVCLAFYIGRPMIDRNYGGWTSGFRWMFWFTPLWLLALLPAADRMAMRRQWRVVALVLLAISVVSAAYANLNPWTHPWLFNYWSDLGWIKY